MQRLKKTLLIFIFLQNFISNAQTIEVISLPNYTSNNKNSVQLFGAAEVASTTFSTSLLKKYLSNSYVDETDRKNLQKHNDGLQRFGFENNYGVSLFLNPDSVFKRKNKLTFNVNVEQKSVFSTLFTNDVLETIINGNSKFIGDTSGISLSPITIEQFKYQKYGVGVGLKFINDSNTTCFFVRASYVNAQKYSNLLTHNSHLKFADSTYAMSGNVDFSFTQSQTNNAYFANNGKGAALDFGLTYVANNTVLTLSANDIGFIKWNNLSLLKVDTSFVYNGYKIDMQRLLHDTLYKISVDSVFNISNHKSQISSTTTLPYTIKLNAQVNWYNSKLTTTFDFTFRNLIAFNPRIFVSQAYKVNEKFSTGLFVASGGFTKLQYGLMFNIKSNKFFGKAVIVNPHTYFVNSALPIAGISFLVGYSW